MANAKGRVQSVLGAVGAWVFKMPPDRIYFFRMTQREKLSGASHDSTGGTLEDRLEISSFLLKW